MRSDLFITGKFSENSTLVIGKFDGLHLGHVSLIEYAKSIAIESQTSIGVLTFDPNPIEYFEQNQKPFYLTSLQDKVSYIINDCKVDFVCVVRFNSEFANLSCLDFIKIVLYEKLNIKNAVVGINYAFGTKRSGNADILTQIAADFGISTSIYSLKSHDLGEVISSGLIRKYLENGDVIHATNLLGRYFKISGIVVCGFKIAGAKLQHKTANIFTEIKYVNLKYGVYKCWSILYNSRYNKIK